MATVTQPVVNLQAVRALRRAFHANREYFRGVYEWGVADAAFDHGEFGGGQAAAAQADYRAGELREAVAARFGLTGQKLEFDFYYYEMEEEWKRCMHYRGPDLSCEGA